MHTLQRAPLLIFVVLLVVSACLMPTVTFTDPVLQATLQALTVEAAVRGTQMAANPPTASADSLLTPSLIPSAILTPAPSLSPTPSLTPSPSSSPTPLVPMMSVSVPTNCRTGPGKAYPLVGALLVGEVAQVYARDPTGRYWYIQNPDSPGDFCWVWDEYATFYGFIGLLPVYTPPPTPTPTFTPTPVPSVEAGYDGMVWCNNSWWVRIALENTGHTAFRSIAFTLRDLHLSTVATEESDGFFDRPDCSSSNSRSTLEPGKTVIVGSPTLDNDPSGHKMRARITLCTKNGQEGICITNIIEFKP